MFKRLLNPFLQPRPLDQDEHLSVSIFLAFQLVRTPRHRREFELMGDYLIRSTNASTPDIGEIRVVPDPNLHLEYFTRSAAQARGGALRPTERAGDDRPTAIHHWRRTSHPGDARWRQPCPALADVLAAGQARRTEQSTQREPGVR